MVDTQRLETQPAATLREICAHIGADPDQAPRELPRLNVGDENLRPVTALGALRRTSTGRHVERRLHQRLSARAGSTWDRLTTRPNPARQPSADLADRLREVLESDTAALRTHLGDDAPSWARGVSGPPAPAAS